MGVTFIAPAGTVTSPAKLITKNIADNGTYDAADDLANGYSKVTVNVEGGGSSDFSTAEVTVTNNTNAPATAYGSFIMDGETFTYQVPLPPSSIPVPMPHIQAVLWNGHSNIVFPNDATLTITGNATDEGSGLVDVTGDCTITIS